MYTDVLHDPVLYEANWVLIYWTGSTDKLTWFGTDKSHIRSTQLKTLLSDVSLATILHSLLSEIKKIDMGEAYGTYGAPWVKENTGKI
jgi:hypothetical protein